MATGGSDNSVKGFEKFLFAERAIRQAMKLYRIRKRELPDDCTTPSHSWYTDVIESAINNLMKIWFDRVGQNRNKFKVSTYSRCDDFIETVRDTRRRLFSGSKRENELLNYTAFVSVLAVYYYNAGVLDVFDYGIGLIAEIFPKDFKGHDWNLLNTVAYSFASSGHKRRLKE